MRILIAPDKFKGTLTAREAARAIARGWRRVRPTDSIVMLPITDGGDGFAEVMGTLAGARRVTCRTVNAAHRPCNSTWWWDAARQTAIIEAAETIGLARLPAGRFHPFELDTAGLAAVFRAAQSKGAKRILIGIGGSATNDGGFGLATAMGWKFLTKRGERIQHWPDLISLESIEPPTGDRGPRVIVAVDVQNPLLGVRGATRIFGPQKGLVAGDVARAEACLRQLARVVRKSRGRSPAACPGTGAAGGLGFGLATFHEASLRPGFELFSQVSGIRARFRRADLVITGEGCLDRSSLMGKGVGQLARLCRDQSVACVALCGTITARQHSSALFEALRSLTDRFKTPVARRRPAACLATLAAEYAAVCIRA